LLARVLISAKSVSGIRSEIVRVVDLRLEKSAGRALLRSKYGVESWVNQKSLSAASDSNLGKAFLLLIDLFIVSSLFGQSLIPCRDDADLRPSGRTPSERPKRVGELRDEAGWHRLPFHPKHLRLTIRRQVQGAEERVEKRKETGEILVAALGLGRMVPAVEARAREHVAEGPEIPRDVGVEQDGVEGAPARVSIPRQSRGL